MLTFDGKLKCQSCGSAKRLYIPTNPLKIWPIFRIFNILVKIERQINAGKKRQTKEVTIILYFVCVAAIYYRWNIGTVHAVHFECVAVARYRCNN